jgi:hypothetical protein
MSRRWGAALVALGLLALAAPLAAHAATTSAPVGLLAGYGAADATWDVGAGAGQYASKAPPTMDGNDIDPQQHSLTQADSYGVASRLSIRAIVLEGTNHVRIALVKSDSYLAQNPLLRRAGQLLADAGSSITTDHILHSATHDHNSPYYFTPSAGVWAFQDAMDLRAFEYQARAMRDAILAAEADLQPARVGATVVHHDVFKGNIAGRGLDHDGTPVGYPKDFGDLGVTVLRFEALDGTPIAAWANWGQHPESLEESDLITADYLGPLQRMVERQTGAPLVFTQGDVGSSEGPYFGGNDVLPDGVVKAWAHVGYAQMERGARYLADAIVAGWEQIGDASRPACVHANPHGHRCPAGVVPMASAIPVDALTYWAPGPVSHPYPSVGNCRTNVTAAGDPGVPAAGLPDCQRTEGSSPVHDHQAWDNLRGHGLVADNYDAPSLGSVEENARLQLQVARIGDVILGSCSCEAQVDLILNFESRADDVAGDIWDGYPWDQQCTDAGNGTWTCPDPDHPGRTSTVTDAAFQRMKAEIHNDAAGWDDPAYAPYANSEPTDPAQIKGNFTKEELATPGMPGGYRIAVGLGHTGDYNGYTVSYREYMSRDAYRKALTSYGPHTADYMVTRLVRMAGALHDGVPFVPDDALGPAAAADEARQEAEAVALGQASNAEYEAWRAAIADDAGPARVTTQPASIERFDAARVSGVGGSTAVDNPTVRVERLDGVDWVPYADQSGEIQTMLDMPDGIDGVAEAWTGTRQWTWTATFEAFDGFPATHGQVPDGTYRFVVDGHLRTAGIDEPYHLESDAFDVTPWDGIDIADVRVVDGDVHVTVDPITYPRTYDSPLRWIADDGNPVLCMTCSFRPWASTGSVAGVRVDVVGADDTVVRTVDASLVGGDWVADTSLAPGETVVLRRGGVVDEWGEINGDEWRVGADGAVAVSVTVASRAVADGPEVSPPLVPISSSRPFAPVGVAMAALFAALVLVVRKVLG